MTEEEVKLYECPVCDKRFVTNEELEVHVNNEAAKEEQPY